MKYKLEIEGCYYEDWDQLKEFANLRDVISANWEAKSEIRSLLKHDDKFGAEENDYFYRALERINDLLYVEGMD